MMRYQDMQQVLQDLQQAHAKPAVSIFIRTHRTFPDNDKDSIALKNQLKLAETNLKKQYDEEITKQVMRHIQQQLADLNQNYNLDTLAIFATPEQAQVVRFPFKAEERVVINDRFMVQDILRNLLSAVHYYVVVATREKGRLIEAVDDRVVHEFDPQDTDALNVLPFGAFPMQSDNLTATRVDERAGVEDNYIKEFMNRIDKNLQAMRARNNLPVIVVGDKRNLGFYQEVSDQPASIIATVDNITHMDNSDAQHIIDGVQNAVKHYQRQQQEQASQEIQSLRGSSRVRTDLQDIYRAALEGNAATLYVRQNYSLAGHLDADQRAAISEPTSDSTSSQNDMVDDLIELVRKNSGQVMFLDPAMTGELEPLVLVTRY